MKPNTLTILSLLVITICSLTITSCKKEGCTDVVSKNYDSEAREDDGSCEYYTNTEFLTVKEWVYISVTTTGDAAYTSLKKDFFRDCTYNFTEDGSYTNTFPAEPTSNSTGTWEFSDLDSRITYDKDTDDEMKVVVARLDITNFNMVIHDYDTGLDVTVLFAHE